MRAGGVPSRDWRYYQPVEAFTRVARVTGSLSSNSCVQRIRVAQGWNLAALAVSTSLSDRLGELISAALRSDPGSLQWIPVATSESFPAETVVWIHAPTNLILHLAGAFRPSAGPRRVRAGAIPGLCQP